MEEGSAHSGSVVSTLEDVLALEMNALARATESVFEHLGKTME